MDLLAFPATDLLRERVQACMSLVCGSLAGLASPTATFSLDLIPGSAPEI